MKTAIFHIDSCQLPDPNELDELIKMARKFKHHVLAATEDDEYHFVFSNKLMTSKKATELCNREL